MDCKIYLYIIYINMAQIYHGIYNKENARLEKNDSGQDEEVQDSAETEGFKKKSKYNNNNTGIPPAYI